VLSSTVIVSGFGFPVGFTTTVPDLTQGGLRFAPDGASALVCERTTSACPPSCSGPMCRLVSAALAGGAPVVLSAGVPATSVIQLPALGRYAFVGDVSNGTLDSLPVGVLRPAPPAGPATDLLPAATPVEAFTGAPDGRRLVAIDHFGWRYASPSSHPAPARCLVTTGALEPHF
jgi:hypothetical protein